MKHAMAEHALQKNVEALSKHVEKMMTLLRVEAAAKASAQEEARVLREESKQLKKKIAVLTTENNRLEVTLTEYSELSFFNFIILDLL